MTLSGIRDKAVKINVKQAGVLRFIMRNCELSIFTYSEAVDMESQTSVSDLRPLPLSAHMRSTPRALRALQPKAYTPSVGYMITPPPESIAATCSKAFGLGESGYILIRMFFESVV